MIVTAVDHRRVQYDKLTERDTVVPVTNDIPAGFRKYPAGFAPHKDHRDCNWKYPRLSDFGCRKCAGNSRH